MHNGPKRWAAIALAASVGVVVLGIPADAGGARRIAKDTLKGRIAYVAKVDGDYELFVMRADGSRVRRLTHNRVDDLNPAWAPSGRRLVFERENVRGYGSDLFIFHLKSGEDRKWVGHNITHEGSPEWSPNGRWIAYSGNDGGDGSDVLARRVRGGEPRVVISQQENSSNVEPTWSPNGEKIALIESFEDSFILLARFCCSQGYRSETVSPDDNRWKTRLDWSPAGTCLLYSTWDEEGDIWVQSAQGGTPEWIYSDSGEAEAGSWSPSGRRFVFSSDRRGSRDIYVARRNGTGRVRLTDRGVHEQDPAWYGRSKDPVRCN